MNILNSMDKLKIILVLLIIIAFYAFVVGIGAVGAETLPEEIVNGDSKALPIELDAKAAILIEASTGKIISVVLGSPTGSARKADTEALMNYGFNKFSFDTVAYQGDLAGKAAVSNGKDTEVDLVVAENVGALVPANQDYDLKTVVTIESASAPITKGDVLGGIIVTNTKGEILNKTDLVAAEDVKRHSFISSGFRSIRSLFGRSSEVENNM